MFYEDKTVLETAGQILISGLFLVTLIINATTKVVFVQRFVRLESPVIIDPHDGLLGLDLLQGWVVYRQSLQDQGNLRQPGIFGQLVLLAVGIHPLFGVVGGEIAQEGEDLFFRHGLLVGWLDGWMVCWSLMVVC